MEEREWVVIRVWSPPAAENKGTGWLVRVRFLGPYTRCFCLIGTVSVYFNFRPFSNYPNTGFWSDTKKKNREFLERDSKFYLIIFILWILQNLIIHIYKFIYNFCIHFYFQMNLKYITNKINLFFTFLIYHLPILLY